MINCRHECRHIQLKMTLSHSRFHPMPHSRNNPCVYAYIYIYIHVCMVGCFCHGRLFDQTQESTGALCCILVLPRYSRYFAISVYIHTYTISLYICACLRAGGCPVATGGNWQITNEPQNITCNMSLYSCPIAKYLFILIFNSIRI